ncbi:MAG: glycosyltransferase family 2 protein [Burkholderiaceae bacterium]
MADETLVRPPAHSEPATATPTDGSVSPPWISLILATYGRSEELSVVLDSLVAQTETGFEVIVVDQNADDRLNKVLAAYAMLRIRHLKQSEPNLSLARNRGLEAAGGDWVAFPDDDCWYEPDCLFKVRHALTSEKNLDGVVATWVEVEGDKVRPMHDLALSAWRDFRGGDASSITLFLRRERVAEQAGFDTRIGVGQFFGAGEETDLVLRLLADHRRLRFLPEARVHHHFSQERPVLSKETWLSTLKRARGVGAIYAKHELRLWVILRGLLAPLINPLRTGQPLVGLVFGIADVIGRCQGLLYWRRRSGNTDTTR